MKPSFDSHMVDSCWILHILKLKNEISDLTSSFLATLFGLLGKRKLYKVVFKNT